MPKLGNNLNCASNQIQNVIIHMVAGDPGSPGEGQLWYDSTNHILRIKDNSANRTLATLANALSAFAVPVADVSWNSNKITNLHDPSSAQDAATKNYVDMTVNGLQIKPTARLATTAALATNVYANGTAGVGATITASSNGALSIDGQAVAASDLVLVKNESATANNGLYTVTTIGDGSTKYVLTRHADMDQTGEFSGAFIPVGNAGTTNANSLWLANPSGSVTVGSTSIPFTQLNGATDLTPGTGISISGNTIAIVSPVTVLTGGTGQTTAAAARGTSGLGSQTAPSSATNVVPTARGIPTKVSAVITADGAATSFTFTHNLATSDVICQLFDNASPRVEVMADINITDTNNVAFVFATAPANSTVYNAEVIG